MKLVVQLVLQAEVKRVSDQGVTGTINNGLFILCGIHKNDSEDDARRLSRKISNLRVFEDEKSKMNKNIVEVGGSILVVSQFTLISDTSHGNRPSFFDSADREKAYKLYRLFVEELRGLGIPTEEGSFGDKMEIDLKLSGPVTLCFDSRVV